MIPDPVSALAVVAIFVALAEGGVAAAGAMSDGASPTTAVAAAAGAAALILGPLAVATLVLGSLARTRSARRLFSGLAKALGGPEGHPGVALLLSSVAMAAATLAGTVAGTELATAMTARFASAGEALVVLVALGAALLFLSPVGALLARAVRAVTRRSTPSEHELPMVLLLLAAGAAALAARAVAPGWAVAPAVGIATLALAAFGPLRRRTLDRAGRKSSLAVALVLAIAGGSALGWLDALPQTAVGAVAYRAPFAGAILANARKRLDRDGDGFAALLAGGDCNDGDVAVHPHATDVPDNDRDENCSGADATRYVPPPTPPYEVPSSIRRPANVVLVLIDALRPDHLGFAGYHRPTSPNIDAFRRRAIHFENAYTTAPSTRFAMASLFTGFDVRRVPHRDLGGNEFELLPGATTIAERLRPLRYDTVGYTISYVIHHNVGNQQGFRVFETPWPVDEWQRNYPVAAEKTTDSAIAYLDGRTEADDQRYFLFLHYQCTHDPYIAHEEWDFGDEDIDEYDSALAYCDREIGRLIDRIDDAPDADRTAVILFSDHGELFGEHGLTNHGNSLYETDVRIVLLARIPRARPRTVRTPVSIADIAPTVLDLANARSPRDSGSISLLAHLSDAELPERPLFMFTDLTRGAVHYEATAIVSYPWKLIRDRRTGTERLFDVTADPGEERDLSDDRQRDRARLAEMLESYEAFVGTP